MWFSFATGDCPDVSLMLAFVRVWRTRSRTGTEEYIAGQEASGYSSNDAKQKKRQRAAFGSINQFSSSFR